MGRRTRPCGFVDGRSFIWRARSCSLGKEEIRGECAIICLRSSDAQAANH